MLRCAAPVVTFRVPRRLNPLDIPEPFREYAYWFCDLLIYKVVRGQFDEHGFIPLKAEYIRRFVPKRKWLAVRGALEELEVIRCDHRAITGHKAYGFRLEAEYLDSRRIACTDSRLTRKIIEAREEARARLLPVHVWLEHGLECIRFDSTGANSIIRGMRPDADSPLSAVEYRKLLREQGRRLAQGTRYLTVDAYGRVHTSVTSLKKELRKCLTIDGERLVGFDLANSQPLFAGMLCRSFIAASAAGRTRIRNMGFDPKRRASYKTNLLDAHLRKEPSTQQSPSITLAIGPFCAKKQGVLREAGVKRNDLDEYIRLCESGRLYESLMRPGVLRDDVKRQLFRNAFYGRPWIRSALGEQFAELFPTVHGLLQELKVRDFRRAAWLMQHLESALFIGTICERIRKERPQTPLVTIHDSLLTTAGHVAYVEEIIRVEFDRIGIRPALRRERY